MHSSATGGPARLSNVVNTGRSHVEQVMGMAVSFDLRDPVDESLLDRAIGWLHSVDARFSTYKDDSMITRFGRGEIGADGLDADADQVLDLCALLEIETDGAFSIRVPAPNGTDLEPSGLVKGWSVERCARILEDGGARNFTVNAGGDIAARGEPSPGESWAVGIRHPEIADQFAAVVRVPGPIAVATSALYERGQHIIDPRTRRPATGVASVSVVGPDLTYADAYATTLFVMGVGGLNWLTDNHPDYGAFLITDSHGIYATSVFERYRTVHSQGA